MIPQVNARIKKIERLGGTLSGGYTEDYDRPATDPESSGGAGRDEWVGNRPAYYSESRERVSAAQTSTLVLRRSMIVNADHPSIDFAEGDRVTFEFKGADQSGDIQQVEERHLPGMRAYTRLTFEDA